MINFNYSLVGILIVSFEYFICWVVLRFQALVLIVYKIRRRSKEDCNSNIILVHDKDSILEENANTDYDTYKSTICLLTESNTRFENHVAEMITAVNGNCNSYSYGSV